MAYALTGVSGTVAGGGIAIGDAGAGAGVPLIVSHAYSGNITTLAVPGVHAPAGNSLLVMTIANQTAGGNTNFPTGVTGGGLTWTRRNPDGDATHVYQKDGEGASSTWAAPSTGALTDQEMTITWGSNQYRALVAVWCVTSASNTLGSMQGSEYHPNEAVAVTLTPSVANSLIVGIMYKADSATDPTVLSGTTFEGTLYEGDNKFVAFRKTALSADNSTPVTVGTSAPTTASNYTVIHAVEIVPA